MALLRSDVINKDLIEQVLRKKEGTNRVVVSSITVGDCEAKASLLEQRLNVQVNAFIRNRSTDYDWIAKVLRPETGPGNYARFQGLLETEVNFFDKLLPELNHLEAPPPRTFPYLWGDYKSLNREVLLLERQPDFELASTRVSVDGLDLPHVLLAVEWLAKLHGLTYVARRRFEEKNPNENWIANHDWIRKELEDSSRFATPASTEKKLDEAGSTGLKARLVSMARKALQLESSSGNDDKFEQLMERQDWLDEMRRESQNSLAENEEENAFISVCHGQPWAGNVYFRYETDRHDGKWVPVEAIFTDFQSCAMGRTGQDVAHFLLSSTTREFRQNHVETVLQAYLTELEDVIVHQGIFDGPLYTMSALKKDYRKGIYMGITFCLFAMPMLNGSSSSSSDEEVDGGGDTTDSAEKGHSNSLQRSADALMDYITYDM